MKKTSRLILLLFLSNLIFMPLVSAQTTEIGPIFFPTERTARLTACFGDPRAGHAHEGEDIMGERMMPLYAAVDGRVKDVVDPETTWGYALTLEDANGYTYHYLHINNDTPGTDDGAGGTEHAYAPGITEGKAVAKGELIGWMGDSGNAETAGPHLHFEIRRPDKTAIDPYPYLIAALEGVSDYDQEAATAGSPDINADKGLTAAGNSACVSGGLIKLVGQSSVYYCGADGKRYVFPNEKIYFTWYDGFSNVTEVGADLMAGLPLGGNVTYRPGVKMVKVQTDPKVYAVARGGALRWIRSTETAKQLYGENWKEEIHDLPDAFFFDYRIGETIEPGFSAASEDVSDYGDDIALDIVQIEQKVFAAVNEYRAGKGMDALVWDESAAAVARAHSADMAAGRVTLGHDGFEERFSALKTAVGARAVAENVAYNRNAADPAISAVSQWLQSSGHKGNIEGDYAFTGVGVAKEAARYYFTQLFAK